MIRVLAAIVVPPHLAVSGGAKAGEMLSAALSPHCDMSVASMLPDASGITSAPGSRLGPRRIPVTCGLPPLVPWRRMPIRYSTLFYRSDIPRQIRPGAFDLVHIHNPMPALEMARVARACRSARIPYVVSTHGFNEVVNGQRIYGFDLPRQLVWRHLVEAPVAGVVRHAAGVFALSVADFGIVRAMGFAGTELSVVSNGVTMPSPPNPERDRALFARLGMGVRNTPGQITCMFLANHTPNKGLPVLLAAAAKVKRPLRLIIAGDRRPGIDYDGAAAGCRDGQEIVVTGRLDDDEVSALFRRADIFVFPTLADTFPLVVLEAMAHGVPVIASAVGGIPWQVSEESGVLLPAGNADALAAAIEKLADEPLRRAAMARAARERVVREFSWVRAAEAALAGYRRVLSLSQARRTSVQSEHVATA